MTYDTAIAVAAIVGASTGVTSLGWQAHRARYEWRRSGAIVQVRSSWDLDDKGDPELSVECSNVGRAATTVVEVTVGDVSRDIEIWLSIGGENTLPRELAPGVPWRFEIPGSFVPEAAEPAASDRGFPTRRRNRVRLVLKLGDGRRVEHWVRRRVAST